MSRDHQPHNYELLARTSSELSDYDSSSLPTKNHKTTTRIIRRTPIWIRIPRRLARRSLNLHNAPSKRRFLIRFLLFTVFAFFAICAFLVIITTIFFPSYTHPPPHYGELEKVVRSSEEPGRGNPRNEKVFITATLYDAKGVLLGGEWGRRVKELVVLLGPENVFLSVYENDPDPEAQVAMDNLRREVGCNSSLISEHLPLESLPRVILPDGSNWINRMAFLSEVRNRALLPLNTSPIQFDRILFINDVIFTPLSALHLLFSTNLDPSTGLASYGAACAVDFINPFKFYDRFATRDLEGFALGIPFFPWFTDSGAGETRKDVLAQKDAVRVRSCWGGMVAFEATWFQNYHGRNLDASANEGKLIPNASMAGTAISPLRFRYEEDVFWDASECCLIHADLTFLRQQRQSSNSSSLATTTDTGIYTNPYIRVAYSARTLSWLPLTRRAERLYPFIHNLLNHAVGAPVQNPRRWEEPGDEVKEMVWVHDVEGRPEGRYRNLTRTVGPGRFCGTRSIHVLIEHPEEGRRNWEVIRVPDVPIVAED